jgi:P pilus assembly chaperone PapD
MIPKCSLIGVIFFSLCAALCQVQTASAQVSVNNVLVTFTGQDRPVRNLVVSNSGVSAMYVSVRVERFKDLALDSNETVPAEDLLVSPKNFSVAPQGQRTIRILLKVPPADKEQAYRVLLLPQYSEFGEDQVKAAKVRGSTLSLKVATGIGVVVYAQPREVVASLEVERRASSVVFTNKGNVHYTVSGGVSCPSNVVLSDSERQLALHEKNAATFEAKGCNFITGARVHAGRSVTIPLPPNRQLFTGKRLGSAGEFDPLLVESVG